MGMNNRWTLTHSLNGFCKSDLSRGRSGPCRDASDFDYFDSGGVEDSFIDQRGDCWRESERIMEVARREVRREVSPACIEWNSQRA
jgi:hypothetical protein